MDPYGGKLKLINKLGREQLLERLNNETFKRTTISFYRYVILEDPMEMRNLLFKTWNELGCLGRIYVAKEGINAQMNIPEHNFEAFKSHLYSIPEFSDVPFKFAIEDDGKSFIKLSVKVRRQIVADGLKPEDYDVTNVGKHLTAEEWNRKIEEGALVVDMRNYYESEIGHFQGAKLPQAETFRDELPEVLDMLKGHEDKPVLLYCTGGVRCEKTSAYLKHHGFKHVNQLYGGVIEYTRQVNHNNLENKFKGKNFVFDKRLGERISDEIIAHCHQCGKPCDTHTNCKNSHCNLLFIQCEECKTKHDGCCSDRCETIYQTPEEKKKEVMKELGFVKSPRYYRHDCSL
ncbi:rhodanese-related sulfurtransferase [Saccharicrinis sp. FJH2]|uniref:oxygen-dependent tRNA uridine(34) hydroxylase TrhO n=1 Tax=Saccharicrinis sp. FJH65 TaxID=3344659 RepID=UPI0035F2BBA1